MKRLHAVLAFLLHATLSPANCSLCDSKVFNCTYQSISRINRVDKSFLKAKILGENGPARLSFKGRYLEPGTNFRMVTYLVCPNKDVCKTRDAGVRRCKIFFTMQPFVNLNFALAILGKDLVLKKIDETAALLARREFHFAKRASLVVHLRRGDKIYNILTARNRRPRRVFTLHPSGRNSTKKRWNSLSTWFVKGPCTSIAQG